MPYLPGFIGGSAPAQSPAFQQERTVNFIVERGHAGTKTDGALYPAPGMAVFATVAPAGNGRGFFEENGRVFAVVGDRFVEILIDGTVTPRGTVFDDGRPVRICSNGDVGGQLFLTSGDIGYLFDLATNTLSTVLTIAARQCDSMDGFVFVLDPVGSSLQTGPAYDAATFDAFKQRDSQPDPWQAFKVLDGLVYLFGERSTDLFYNAGTSPFPLAQQTAGAFPYGIIAPDSVSIAGQGVAWLGRSASGIGMVLMARGASVQEVSTPALRWVIEGYRRTHRIDDAVGSSFEYLGHTFYMITFPTADATWVFDLSTGEWLEFGEWNPASARFTAWRPGFSVVAFGAQLFLDRLTGAIYRLDVTTALDVTGQPMRRVRRVPTLFNEGQRFRLDEIEVLVEAGLSSPGTPLVTLNYSKDGGKTWAQAASAESAGATGEYRQRVVFTRLGVARDFGLEIVCADDYLYRLVGATMRLTLGRN